MDYAAYYAGAEWTLPALRTELARWVGILDDAQTGGRDRSIAGPDGVNVSMDLVSIKDIERRIGHIQDAIRALEGSDAVAGSVHMILPRFSGIPH